jgi:hypothetical protein
MSWAKIVQHFVTADRAPNTLEEWGVLQVLLGGARELGLPLRQLYCLLAASLFSLFLN